MWHYLLNPKVVCVCVSVCVRAGKISLEVQTDSISERSSFHGLEQGKTEKNTNS